jgi:hypothetical protein
MPYKIFLDNILIDNFKYSYDHALIESMNQGTTPNKIRMVKDFPIIKNGGWHFTYLGGLERLKYKIKSYSHQEFNNDQFLNDKVLEYKLKNGIDLFWPKDYRYIPIKINYRYFPESIIKKYPNLIYSEIHLFKNIIIIFKIYCKYYLFTLPLRYSKNFIKTIIRYERKR